jgi:hypothetical protein
MTPYGFSILRGYPINSLEPLAIEYLPNLSHPVKLPHAQRLWSDAEGERHFVQVGFGPPTPSCSWLDERAPLRTMLFCSVFLLPS